MIDYSGIEATLGKLHSAYDADGADTEMMVLYSKLALLEFCGWIEESLDDIVNSYLVRKAISGDNLTYINGVVSNNYGFKYDKNVRPMFCSTIGICGWAYIESSINSSLFKCTLNAMASKRDTAAHTHTVAQTFDSPSVIRNNYRNIKPIFQAIETEMNTI